MVLFVVFPKRESEIVAVEIASVVEMRLPPVVLVAEVNIACVVNGLV